MIQYLRIKAMTGRSTRRTRTGREEPFWCKAPGGPAEGARELRRENASPAPRRYRV